MLTERQQKAVYYDGGDLLVSAAAGSGKTRVLVERLLAACEKGANIDDFLVITYTRAAAAELRGRIQVELSKRRKEQGGMWERQLMRLHRANIGTIHAFCADLLRENAVQAGVRPDFRLLEGVEETAMRDKALDSALERLYAELPDGFEALADSVSDIGGDKRLCSIILRLYSSLRAHPEPEMWMVQQLETMEHGDPWREYLEANAKRAVEYADRLMRAARDELSGEVEQAYGEAFDDDLHNIAILKHDINAVIVHKNLKRATKSDETAYFQKIRNFYKKLVSFDRFVLSSEERAAALETAKGIFAAVRMFSEEYTALKARSNVLDFSDLEHISRAMLNTQSAVSFTEILVDEYQDVNQVQEDIITRLGGRVFMVGDVRQSVYGFRQADPGIFLKKYVEWASGVGGARVILPHNFRSHHMLLTAVNDIFTKIMLGMEYGPDEMLRPPPGAECTAEAPRAVLVCCDRSDMEDSPLRRVEAEAELCAGLCAELVESGKSPDDIAILLRAKSGMELFKRALEARGIPACGQEDNVYETIELQTAMAYLQILDNPRQDMPLLAVMRSPLYNFTPDELSEVRKQSEGDFYDALTAAADGGNSKCALLWQDLVFLRTLGEDAGTGELYHAMLERLGMLELFESMPGGAVRRDNLLGLTPVAYASATLSELCAVLERRAQSGETDASVQTARGVRLMTMHKSKGLEFDTVIVADLGHEFNRTDTREQVLFHKELGLGLKYTDFQRRVQYPTPARNAVAKRINDDMLCEEMRLLYVALTRAKERLYVTLTVPDLDKRLDALSMGVNGVDPYRLLSASNMSDWMLMALMNNGRLKNTASWEILRRVPSDAVRVSVSDVCEKPQTETKTAKTEYRYAADASLPSKLTVTELLPKTAREPVFPKPRFMEGQVRMNAAERGTALHAAMQNADFKLCGTLEGVKAELERMTAQHRLTPEQAAAVDPAAIVSFVNSQLGRRILSSTDVRREFAFSLLTPVNRLMPDTDSGECVLLQGVVDLLFYEDGGWVVVDFKTNDLGRKKAESAANEYKIQVEMYAEAVERMTGQRVRERTVYFTDGGVAVNS